MQELRGNTTRREVLLDEPRHLDVLREDEHARLFREDRVEQLVEQLQLSGAARNSGLVLLEILRGVVADLLEPCEELDDQPLRANPSAPEMSASVSRTTAS